MENFAAFFSYVHADDNNDNGDLTRLRQKLEGEVQAITGEPFRIFQDDDDIHWGQKWEERLADALDGTTFLIIAVTPRYLTRPACRNELERFLKREQQLGRKDLILPIYYIETLALSDETLRNADPLAEVIASRQRIDWRDLRHEPYTNPNVPRRITEMACKIEKAMRRTSAPKPALKTDAISLTTSVPVISVVQENESSQPTEVLTVGIVASDPMIPESEPQTQKLSPRNDPQTLVVDPSPGRGHYTKIMDAVKAAKPDTRILIRPGRYEEALVLEKALILLGDGERSEIIVETTGANVLLFKTEFGRVVNLTLRQTGSGDFSGVDIAQGRLELEDCDITSQSSFCIAIYNGAAPYLRRNHIHNANQTGIVVYECGRGTFEDNDIFANTFFGVMIETGGDPTMRHNRIYDGKLGGVSVRNNGKGTLEDNEIFANTSTGVVIQTGSDPILRRNRIHNNGEIGGVFVYENGKGVLEDNDIFANTFSGVTIHSGGDPILRGNRIHDGTKQGILVYENGKGTFEDNDIFANALIAVLILTGGDPIMRGNRITKNEQVGIYVHNSGSGTFENNDLRENGHGPWDIDESSQANVKKSGNIES